MNGNSLQSGGVKASSQTLANKEQKQLRSGSSGQPTPPTAPQGPSSSFPRPVYPVPLLSHIPVVRPSPQLHPNVVQRMLAQGIQPQQIAPALVQAGEVLFFFPCSTDKFRSFIPLGSLQSLIVPQVYFHHMLTLHNCKGCLLPCSDNHFTHLVQRDIRFYLPEPMPICSWP